MLHECGDFIQFDLDQEVGVLQPASRPDLVVSVTARLLVPSRRT